MRVYLRRAPSFTGAGCFGPVASVAGRIDEWWRNRKIDLSTEFAGQV